MSADTKAYKRFFEPFIRAASEEDLAAIEDLIRSRRKVLKKPGRKRGNVDSETPKKFFRIVTLMKEGKTDRQIEAAINKEFQQVRGPGANMQLFRQYLPTYVRQFKEHFERAASEEELLATAKTLIRSWRPRGRAPQNTKKNPSYK